MPSLLEKTCYLFILVTSYLKMNLWEILSHIKLFVRTNWLERMIILESLVFGSVQSVSFFIHHTETSSFYILILQS